MSPRVAFLLLCSPVLLALLLAGCRHAPASVSGSGSFEILGSPANVAAPSPPAEIVEQTDIRIDYIPVRACGTLPQPEYPAAALAGGGADCTLFVTFTVDEHGQVADVAPSWNRITLESPFLPQFVEAARAAVTAWELAPARAVYYRRVPGGEDEYLYAEPVADTIEVKFVFDARRETQ